MTTREGESEMNIIPAQPGTTIRHRGRNVTVHAWEVVRYPDGEDVEAMVQWGSVLKRYDAVRDDMDVR